MTYRVTDEFLKMFGLKSIKDLPELPKYKLDSNRQIVIDELEKEENIDENTDKSKENNNKVNENNNSKKDEEAPEPQEGNDTE